MRLAISLVLGCSVIADSSRAEVDALPLLSADIVVQGELTEISHEVIPADEWFKSPAAREHEDLDRQLPMTRLRLRVYHVLRGPQGEKQIDFYITSEPRRPLDAFFQRVTVGAELIVAGTRRLSDPVHSYTFGFDGVFLAAADGWQQGGEFGWRAPLPLETIEEQAQRLTIRGLLENCDIAVHGVIVANEVNPERTYEATVKLRVDDRLKGDAPDTVVVVLRKLYLSPDPGETEWERCVPQNLGVGTPWYAFLAKGEGTSFVPAAGHASFLREAPGGELLTRGDRPSGYSGGYLKAEARTLQVR